MMTMNITEGAKELVFPEVRDCFPRGFSEEFFEVFPGVIYMKLQVSGIGVGDCVCPDCGSDECQVLRQKKREVKDIPYLGRAVTEELLIKEYKCRNCGLESFTSDISGFAGTDRYMTIRMEEFLVFLTAYAGFEMAGRILECMNVTVGEDTLRQIDTEYRNKEGSNIWDEANLHAGSCQRDIDEDDAQEIANRLAGGMKPEILSNSRKQRLAAMTELFQGVFEMNELDSGDDEADGYELDDDETDYDDPDGYELDSYEDDDEDDYDDPDGYELDSYEDDDEADYDDPNDYEMDDDDMDDFETEENAEVFPHMSVASRWG